jgi:AcrR family transcriptional regulator
VSEGTPTRRGRPSRTDGEGADRRAAILAAARESFAAQGFRGTTIRGVAGAAGVDPALVHHYFGSKDDLFLAALELPLDPRAVLPRVLEGDLETAAWRLLGTVLEVWDQPAARLQLAAVVRTGLSAPAESNTLRDGLMPMILGPLAERLPGPHPERRAQLVATQMIGLLVARYVLALEPLASLPREEVVAWVAPNLQRYLTGEPVPKG